MSSFDDIDERDSAENQEDSFNNGKNSEESARDDSDLPEPSDIEDAMSVQQSDAQNVPSGIQKMIGSFMSMSGPPWLAFADKIKSEHISSVIESIEKDNEGNRQDRKDARRHQLIIGLLAVAAFVFFTVYMMPLSSEIYSEIIDKVVVFGGGIGAGYGYRSWKGRRD